MRVLSLGWGVQSFTTAAMIALGELETVGAAIHADTTHERAATYSFAERWTPWLESHGVRVVTVRPARTFPVNNGYGWPEIPAFVAGGGQSQRQCTSRWKIAPMKRWIQANRHGEPIIEQWIGISLDEAERMKPSGVNYIDNRWPLIERRMTRAACMSWLKNHDLEIPVKSSCAFCPFHSRAEWFAIHCRRHVLRRGSWRDCQLSCKSVPCLETINRMIINSLSTATE